MGVTSYRKEVSPGVWKTFYLVVAEGINQLSGLRVQKKRRGIPSKSKADFIYKQLWSACREEKPSGEVYKTWGKIRFDYLEYIEKNVRSPEKPLGFSPHTLDCKKSKFTHTEKWDEKGIWEITPMFVFEELDKLEKKGMSRSNTNEILKEVKSLFTFGLQNGGLTSDPFFKTKLRKSNKKKLPALNEYEAAKLFWEAKRRKHPYYYVWLLSVALGLRRSELAGLMWSDIDYTQGVILVKRQKIPGEGIVETLKDLEERFVAIPKDVVPELKKMQLAAKTEFVIELKCPRWNRGEQAAVLREFCKEIGIKSLTHHRLRATHITLALASDVPLASVKENVGHAQLGTTDRYFSESGLRIKGSMDRLKIDVPRDDGGQLVPLKATN